jgi:tetratricopeptide (TPR) repeat protein
MLGNHAAAETAHRQAIGIFEGLVKELPAEAAYRDDLAGVYISLGNLLARTQRPGQAEQAYREAEGLFQRLAEESPDEAGYRLGLATCRNSQADLLLAAGRYPQAERVFQQAADDLRPFVHDPRRGARCRKLLAGIHNNLGDLYERRDQFADAIQSYREALRLKEALTGLQRTPEVEQGRAVTYLNLGRALKNQGRVAVAEEACAKGVGVSAQLDAEFPSVPDYRHGLAQARILLGNLLWRDRGQLPSAEKEYRESVALLGSLVGEFPDVPSYRADLANATGNLADLCKDTGRPKDAERFSHETVKHLRWLVGKFPEAPAHRAKLALWLYNWEDFLLQCRQYQKAEEVLEEALAHRQELVTRFPEVPQYQGDLAATHFRLGVVFYSTERLAKAEESFREAMKRTEPLEARSRLLPAHAWLPPECLANLGAVQASAGRLQEAEKSWRRAVPQLERLTEVLANRPEGHSHLAAACHNLGLLLGDRDELAESRQYLEKAVRHQRAALRLNPRHPQYGRLLAQHYEKLAATLIALGEHAGAAKTALEMARSSPVSAERCYHAACVLAQCMTLADKDATLSGEKRKGLAQSYGDRAVELLREAVGKGFKDPEHMNKDTALDSLRSRDDFKKLASELEAQKP